MQFSFNKKFLTLIATSTILSSSFAYEWGGLVSAGEKYYNYSMDGEKASIVKPKESVSETTFNGSLWLRIPFSENGESYFITEGLYNTKLKHSDSENDNVQYIDLSLFKFNFAKELSNGNFNASLGRFNTSDLSALVLSQNTDGALLKYNSDNFGLSLYGSYTGLLNKKAVTLNEDLFDDEEEDDDDKVYELSKKLALTSLSLSLPNLIGNQSLSLEALGSFKLEGKSLNRIFGTAKINGEITSNIFYDLSSTLLFAKKDSEDAKISNLSKVNVAFYPEYKSSSLGLSGTFATKNFSTVTSQTAVDSQSSPEYDGILKAGLFGSIKPIEKLLVNLKGDSVFDYNEGNNSDSFGFAGIQVGGSLSFQPYSDLNFSLSATQYIDMDDNKDIHDEKTTIECKIILTF